jgi:hypothetical protein
VLRRIESAIEGLFEGLFGRAFRTNVQPVELARKLAKEMDENRSISVSRVYVPNEYTVYLSTGDRSQFAAYEGSLIGELQEYLMEHAQREGYALLTPARVLVTSDADLAIGEFGISARVVQPDDAVPSLPREQTAPPPVAAPAVAERPTHEPTIVFRTGPGAPEPIAEEPPAAAEPVETVTLTVGDDVIAVTGSRALVGRSKECDVTVADTNVSRRHCEIVRNGGGWLVQDLGSTNGTELNGRRITRAEVADGDRITVGSTDVLFGRQVS